jgi:microcystin-dependent protein
LAETQTPNYKWIKPDIGGDASNWGNVLNATTDAIDSVVYANQQAGVPIGSGALWFTATAPTNWLLCQGQSLDTTVYAALFAILGYAFGGSGANFNLPNFTDIFPIGASATRALAAKGGAATVTLDATMIPTHAHTATQGTHSHGVNQWAHSHGITTGGHNHALHDPTHTHTYATLGGGVNIQPGSGGNMSNTGNTGASGTGITIDAVGNLGGNTDAQTSSVSVVAASAGTITVNPTTGGGKSHDNMPPWLGINFIIRFQ